MTVTRTISQDGMSVSYVNDDRFLRLEDAAARFALPTGIIRQWIAARSIRSKVVRLVEEKWLAEHYLVSENDLAQLAGTPEHTDCTSTSSPTAHA